MASVEPIDELQVRVERYAYETMGTILWEVNQLDNLFHETNKQILLEEQMRALTTQGAYAQEASIQCIKLMKSGPFKDELGSNISNNGLYKVLLDCMSSCWIRKIQVAWTYLKPRMTQHWQTFSKKWSVEA